MANILKNIDKIVTTTGTEVELDNIGLTSLINSISGYITTGSPCTLTLAVDTFSDKIDVRYYNGNTLLATDLDVAVTNGSATSTVPAVVYSQTKGTTITIRIHSGSQLSNNSVIMTVVELPTGGTVTHYGGYRVHTFTTSGNFVVPAGYARNAYILLVGGGASGGGSGHDDGAGGGGAGGFIETIATISSNTTYAITVGGGGSGVGYTTFGNNGGATSMSNISGLPSALGGGGGGTESMWGNRSGLAGASGGGSCGWNTYGGAGTSGQGNKGGDGAAGGGGGAGAAGGNAPSGNGGIGRQNSIRTGSNEYYAGGGGCSGDYRKTLNGSAGGPGNGGLGGGGRGQFAQKGGTARADSGTANTGGGGGGASGVYWSGTTSGNGGSGVVIIRYEL